MEDDDRAVRVIVVGTVQGVGFRAFVMRAAVGRDLRGFVRNRRDGSVEAIIAGGADDVAALCEACGRGPPHARVERMSVTPAGEGAVYPAFSLWPDA